MNGNYEAMKFLAGEQIRARQAEAERHRQARSGGALPVTAAVRATICLAGKLTIGLLRAVSRLARRRVAALPRPRFEH